MERVRGREGGDQREGEGEGEGKREAWRERESDCEGGEGGKEIRARMLSLVLQKWRIQRKETKSHENQRKKTLQ